MRVSFGRETLPGDRASDVDDKGVALLFVEFVHKVEHGNVELDAQPFGEVGQPIEKGGIVPAEVDGDDVALRLDAFADKRFLPSDVLNPPIDLARAQAGGKQNDVVVAAEGCVDHAREVSPVAACLVDGNEEGGESGEVHQ